MIEEDWAGLLGTPGREKQISRSLRSGRQRADKRGQGRHSATRRQSPVDSFCVVNDYKPQFGLLWALAGERCSMEEQLSLEFLRVVENGAVAAARTMGFGDRHKADEVAVEAMRKTMDAVQMDGTIVIGEGERDEAPMLYIGEKVGLATHAPKALFPEVDIAVDPLEGTNLCATGAGNSIAVLAASERGGLLHAPDLYMEKIVV